MVPEGQQGGGGERNIDIVLSIWGWFQLGKKLGGGGCISVLAPSKWSESFPGLLTQIFAGLSIYSGVINIFLWVAAPEAQVVTASWWACQLCSIWGCFVWSFANQTNSAKTAMQITHSQAGQPLSWISHKSRKIIWFKTTWIAVCRCKF